MAATKDQWKRIPFTSGDPIRFQAVFSREEFERLREGLIPKAMEDKWFVYFEAPYLYLHLSWTGEPVYRLTLVASTEGASVAEALCVGKVLEKTGPEYQAALLDFLISNLLLGQSKPFPVPPGFAEARTGLLQHAVAGTGFPQTRTTKEHTAHRKWWERLWRVVTSLAARRG
jgi:hypothetical protein